MLFRRLSYLTIGLLFLIGCTEEDSNGVKLENTISSIEEVNALIAETRFVIEMPNGQVVDFIPSKQFSGPSSTNYSSVGNGFDFSSSNAPIVVSKESILGGSADLILDGVNYDLPIVFCVTASELRSRYGFELDVSFNSYVAYFAISSGGYTEEEVVNFAPVGVDNFLFYFVDPNGLDLRNGNFYNEDRETFFLSGSYSIDNSTLTCQGTASFLVFVQDDFFFEPFGDFASVISCN